MTSNFSILAYWQYFFGLIPILIGLLFYKGLARELKILVGYLITGAIFDTAIAISSSSGYKLFSLFHVFTLIEYILLCIIIRPWVPKRSRSPINYSLLLFGGFWLIAKFTFEPFTTFDHYTLVLSSLLLTMWSSLAIMEQSEHFVSSPFDNFQLAVPALLCFHSSVVLLLLLIDFHVFRSYFSISASILTSIGFSWCLFKARKSVAHS